MTIDASSVALADLSATAPLASVEAATIVRELMRRVTRAEVPGIPSLQVIRLAASGAITVEGPVAADARNVAHAAHLLDVLLTGRVPGALRLVVARARGTLDLPPYPSLDAFADALGRFATDDVELCVRGIIAARTPACLAPLLESLPIAVNAGGGHITISDIRRARRATGLTLTEIAGKTGIPAPLLCELEWGYLRHWPPPGTSRRLILDYARAAGLDDQLVLRTAWPLLEACLRDRDGAMYAARDFSEPEIIDAVPVEDDEDEPAALAAISPFTRLATMRPVKSNRQRRGRGILVAALAIPALLLIGIAPALRNYVAPVTHHAAPTTAAPATNVTRDVDRSAMEPQAPARQVPAQAAPARDLVRPVRLSDGPTYSPSFDSAGSAMFYQAESHGRSALMRADTDRGGAILRITSVVNDRARNFHARPSPDGKWIAFDSDRDGERGVYIANADGQHVRRLTGDGFAAVPSWSPDGKTLAFVRAEEGRPNVWNLWTIELESGTTTRLTSYRFGQPWGGSWFPDGRRIAYSHEDRLVVLNLATGASKTYLSPRKGTLLRTPAVSPDGTRAVFQLFHDGAWLLDFKTGAMKKVLADPSAEEFTWAPDGRRVAYHSRSAGTWGVWILDERGISR